jgi:hypothetical protein
VVASLLGYFLYVVTAFTATIAVLIGLFDHSMLAVHRYPHSVAQIVSTANTEDHHVLVTPGTKKAPAKKLDVKELAGSRAVALARAKPKKTGDRKILTQLERPKLFARLRENAEEHRFRFALGYAEGAGYPPGLDGQR